MNPKPTHVPVLTTAGAVWDCPVGYLPTAIERGWVEVDPDDVPEPVDPGQTGFDPTEHTVDEVNVHLAEHAEQAPGEVARVLKLEEAGPGRKGVLDGPHAAATTTDLADGHPVDDDTATDADPTTIA